MILMRRRSMSSEGKNYYASRYLTFQAIEDCTFQLSLNSIEYSVDDGNTWNILPAATASPEVKAGKTIMWKRVSNWVYEGTGTFSSSGKFLVYGNSMSLLYGDAFLGKTSFNGNYALKYLFKNNKNLVSAKDMVLPAKALTGACYYHMFFGCSNLEDCPDLMFTSHVGGEACLQMFSGCVNMRATIVLRPATLMQRSYFAMFQGCRSVSDITILATDISASNCLYLWVTGVAATGRFTKKTGVDYPIGASGIPEGWTVIEIP